MDGYTREELADLFESRHDPRYYEQAVPMYEAALGKEGNSVTDLFTLAFLHEKRAEQLLNEARELTKRALEEIGDDIYPDFYLDKYKIMAHLCRIYIKQQQSHEAVELVKARIQAQPDDAKMYLQLANCYMLMRQLDDAKAVIDAAMKLAPEDACVLCFAGDVAKLLGKYEEAFEYWERSYQNDSEICDGLYSAAFLHAELGHIAGAIEKWRAVIRWLEERNMGEVALEWPQRELAKLEETKKL